MHFKSLAGTVGITNINDNDVLSGRGGGTNLHPGNRAFRDLINLYRRDYLKARKNDKPAISRSIVNTIRQKNGRFLKKVEKTGLWFEIGDDAAREKTSQALRQRAPEMRKLLLDHEMEGARTQQQMMMGVPPMMMNMNMPMNMMMGPNGNAMTGFNPAMMGMGNGNMQMFNPALMGMPMGFNGMPQFDSNGNPIMPQLQNGGTGMDQNQQQQQGQGQNQQQNNNPQNQDQNQQQQQQIDNNQNQPLHQQHQANIQQQPQQQQNLNDQSNQMMNPQMMGMNPNQMNGMSNTMGAPDSSQAPVQATM